MLAKLAVFLGLAVLAVPPATAPGAIGVSHNRPVTGPAHPSSDGPAQQEPIAAAGFCPGKDDADASQAIQQEAMRCLIDYARHDAGLAPLSVSERLDRSAEAKSADILRCDDFDHYACGRDFNYWLGRVGYLRARCWRVGENLAWSSSPKATARQIFRLLMHSPEHRANILGSYSQVGVGLRVGNLRGHSAAHVWTQHFGSHC